MEHVVQCSSSSSECSNNETSTSKLAQESSFHPKLIRWIGGDSVRTLSQTAQKHAKLCLADMKRAFFFYFKHICYVEALVMLQYNVAIRSTLHVFFNLLWNNGVDIREEKGSNVWNNQCYLQKNRIE